MREMKFSLAALAAALVLILLTPFTASASPKQSIDPTPIPQSTDPNPPYDEFPADEGTAPTETTPAVGEPTTLERQSPSQEPEAAAMAAPVIDVWDNGPLVFGLLGNPQNRINIRGNVRDPDTGGSITKLEYRLGNGSYITIPFATSDYSDIPNRRLIRKGDFNIEINTTSLSAGDYTVMIRAWDNTGQDQSRSVTFTLHKNGPWRFPYYTEWNKANSINEQAQIVDGNWQFDTSVGYRGVRPVTTNIGYDRLIAIGETNWKNYIVTVPITVLAHGGKEPGGVGIIANWQGHTGSGPLPFGWGDLGAYGYFSWRNGGLAMWLNGQQNPVAKDTSLFQLQDNVTYIFKLRAEKISGGGRYSLKVWQAGTAEPAWDAPQFQGVYNVVDTDNDQTEGSIMLVAHYVDAVFGDVTITWLNEQPTVPLNNKVYIPAVKR